jgi:quercetin dioxygenase-like cupin family protein
MTCAERPVCPHTDDQADKMLRDARMAAMTGRTAACWAGGESPQRAVHVCRGEIVWQDRCDAANGSKEPKLLSDLQRLNRSDIVNMSANPARKRAKMPYPDFISAFPSIDVPFPEDVVQTAVVQSDDGLVAFFTFLKDMELPPHSHGAQWGTVIEGQIEFTICGETKTYEAGDSYSIPAGVEHGAVIKSGTRVIDVFEEADRYAIKK